MSDNRTEEARAQTITPTTIRDNLKALSAYLEESTGKDFMFESVEQAIVLLGEGWEPIETAPKDGRQILIEVSGHAVAAVWSSWNQSWYSIAAVTPVNPSQFMLSSDIMLVHISGIPQRWRPLPSPPK